MSGGWVPDLLGRGFEQRTLPLADDDQGAVVATLVRSAPGWLASIGLPLRDVDVLYVHGWSDYFFQTRLAHFWNGLGARFFALDLRKYGRSLRDWQTPGYITDLATYDEDIAAALSAMGHTPDAAGRRRLVLMGHSTGGLTLTLWASRHPGVAAALVLNSPWLELQIGKFGREILAPLVGVRARWDPQAQHPEVDLGYYTRAQTEVGSLPVPGYQDRWRPARGFPTHPGWFNAVITGHRQVAAGLDVGSPVLTLLSARSATPFQWSEALTSADSVLVVDDIAARALHIGTFVTVARIDGALHDVFLSRPAAQDVAYSSLEHWLRLLEH